MRHFPKTHPKLQRAAQLLWATSLTLLCSACQNLGQFAWQKGGDAVQSEHALQQLAHASVWHVTGKIGVQSNGKGDSAQFDWQVHGDRFVLRLIGPWSARGITLYNTDQAVYVVDPRGKVRQGPSVEALSEQILGWPVPWDALRYWVRGQPAPVSTGTAPPHVQWKQGQLQTIVQNGWDIQYLSFSHTTGFPQKIHAFYTQTRAQDSSPTHALTIKLWCDRWNLAASDLPPRGLAVNDAKNRP